MRGLIIQRDESLAELYSMVLSDMGHEISIQSPERVESQKDIVNLLKAKYEFILLPLSLQQGLSLRLAELVHLGQIPTRLILLSRTECPREKLLRLFDGFCNPLYGVDELRSAVERPARRHLHPEEVHSAISDIIAGAICFFHQGAHGTLTPDFTFENYKVKYVSGSRKPEKVDTPEISIQNLIIEELSMSKDHIHIQSVVGPVNIKSHLKKVEQTVTNSPNVSHELQKEFSSLVSRLQEVLDKVASASPDDGHRILQSMEMVATEIAKPKPSKVFLKITLEGLKEAASAVKSVAPAALEVVENIFTFVKRHYLQT